jgi:nucleoside-diphosphate-sugar epimerase
MPPTSKGSASDREILLVGPYGVLGTGVIDAVAANPVWRITSAARRPAPTYRTQTPPRHISVDLMDRDSTIKAFSNLDTVTDLVYAAYVEKPTMAETVAPNAGMLTNTLEALAARKFPLKRIVLAAEPNLMDLASARSTHQPRNLSPVLSLRSTITNRRTSLPIGRASMERVGQSCVRISSWDLV